MIVKTGADPVVIAMETKDPEILTGLARYHTFWDELASAAQMNLRARKLFPAFSPQRSALPRDRASQSHTESECSEVESECFEAESDSEAESESPEEEKDSTLPMRSVLSKTKAPESEGSDERKRARQIKKRRFSLDCDKE
jgi:hypothetical protein